MVMQREEEPPPSGAIRQETRREGVEGSGEQGNVLLVPTDFSEESGYALKHAQRLGRSMELPVVLLHVMGDGEQEEVELGRLRKQAESVFGRGCDGVLMRLARGVVNEVVPREASAVGAEYVILGSRDAKNPVEHKHSTSLNLLRTGRVPYVTVQQNTSVRSYQDVVLPIDYTDESQKHYGWLDRLCCYFEPTFHLVRPDVNEPELEERVDENVTKVMSLLSERGIPHTVRTVPGDSDYALEILQVARELESDLIVVITSVDPRKKGSYMLEPHARRLVLQAAEIPVMTVNPE